MPRPGPRPYECVRRAWHSDRHLPMRGSLIQEIFRVANEIHSTQTRKNKEWQDKLPIVVLKAEEIMYSKANSEAEYMDLKTLWDRTNDAINTIIRLDDSTETGVYLQPCIEAALNLGCTPRRSSRSQRNNTPSCYLSATNQEPTCVPSSNIENTTQLNHMTNGPFLFSNFARLASKNSTPFGLEPHSPVVPNNHFALSKSSLPPKRYPASGKNEGLYTKNCPASNSCSVYALHYADAQSKVSSFQLGTEPGEKCVKKNLSSCNLDTSNKTTQESSVKKPESPLDIGFDLSLRLGPLVGPCISIENSWPHENDDVGSSTSPEGSKLSDSSPKVDKSFSFIPMATTGDPLCSDRGKLTSKTESSNVDKTLRKRKADVSEDRQFSWQLEIPFKHFSGRMSNAGS